MWGICAKNMKYYVICEISKVQKKQDASYLILT